MHFGHEVICTFANRPFDCGKKIDNVMIENWNNTVPADGLTFVLGDIGKLNKVQIVETMNKLNGRKILLRGNHDAIYKESVLLSVFEEVYDLLYIRIRDDKTSKYQYIVLSHYPMFDWQSSFRGAWQLFGHLHTRGLVEFDYLKTKLFPTQYDVGVDNNNFTPVSFYDVKRIISEQKKDKRFKRSNYYI